MSSYPPPPPDSYSALYASPSAAQQLLDSAQQDQQLHFTNLNQPIYPEKSQNGGRPYSPSAHTLAQELQQANLDESEQIISTQPLSLDHLDGHAESQQLLPAQDGTPGQAPKPNRLRKACDSCSIRKVRCDESGPPCKACSALDIPCTFERPSRRRGPPNRHADAIKRRRLDDNATPPHISGTPSNPSSPTHAAQALAALSSHAASGVSAESILPTETLELLIDDFFTYLYPSYPFPHESSFRQAWKQREDRSNKSFLALLAAMIGALVASFPRKPRLSLKSQKREHVSPEYLSIIQRCQHVCAAARGPGYLESDDVNVYDAATSFFLARICIYTSRWRQAQRYLGECITTLGALDLNKSQPEGVKSTTDNAGAEVGIAMLDDTAIETGRRILWAVIICTRSHEQFHAETNLLVIRPTWIPPMPNGLDDSCSGFNAIATIYKSYDDLTSASSQETINWDHQKQVLRGSLRECGSFVANIVPDLAASDGSSHGVFLASIIQPRFETDPLQSITGTRLDTSPEQSVEGRLHLQSLIQKADIYASVLAARMHIVRRYWTLYAALPNPPTPSESIESEHEITREIIDEQENIVRDVRNVLSSIDEVNRAPDADSFVSKIRAVARSVVDQVDERSSSRESISAFLDILQKLEDNDESEDSLMHTWAEMRDVQMKLAQEGGLFGMP